VRLLDFESKDYRNLSENGYFIKYTHSNSSYKLLKKTEIKELKKGNNNSKTKTKIIKKK